MVPIIVTVFSVPFIGCLSLNDLTWRSTLNMTDKRLEYVVRQQCYFFILSCWTDFTQCCRDSLSACAVQSSITRQDGLGFDGSDVDFITTWCIDIFDIPSKPLVLHILLLILINCGVLQSVSLMSFILKKTVENCIPIIYI